MTVTGTVWRPVGPSPIDAGREDNGTVTCIVVHPSNPDIIYRGTNSGGLWKTIDGGATWRALFDHEDGRGIGEAGGVALDPNDLDVVYVGISDHVFQRSFSGPFINTIVRRGLYRSLDGGASWVLLGSGFPEGNTGNATNFANVSITEVIVDPANSNRLYVAADDGVHVSTDRGLNWTLGAGLSAAVDSLELDTTTPANARVLYAGVNGSGVFQSTDGGANWTSVLSLPAGAEKVIARLAPPTSPPAANGIQVIYCCAGGSGATDPLGFWVSTDAGTNWTQQTATSLPAETYNNYCLAMAVDPSSPGDGVSDVVYVGTRDQGVTRDSGLSFSSIDGLHSDSHAWAFAPPRTAGDLPVVLCGTDGGLMKSTDRDKVLSGTPIATWNWTSLNAGGVQTTLFYNVDGKPDPTSTSMMGTLQDNGLLRAVGPGTWTNTRGGDGWDVVYDIGTNDRAYGATNGGVWLSINDGANWSPVAMPWSGADAAGDYLNSLAVDPSNTGVVYITGSTNLWQSRDASVNWNNIFSPNARGVVAVAPSDGNYVAVSGGSQVFVSQNALATSGISFTPMPNLPARNVTRLEFDPNDPTRLYAVLGGYAAGGAAGHVFRTTLGASQWTDISPAASIDDVLVQLDVPFGALALDGSDLPTTIYVGCDLGVLRSVNDGASWMVVDDIHLPRVPVTDLAISGSQHPKTLRVATYGRGVFQFVKPDWPAIAVTLEEQLEFGTVCPAGDHLTIEVANVGKGPLHVDSIAVLLGSSNFLVENQPATPILIEQGEQLVFTLTYRPTRPNVSEAAVIRISSDDPDAPFVDVTATAQAGAPELDVSTPPGGDLGEACLGDHLDSELMLTNSGACPLTVTSIVSNRATFAVAWIAALPLTIAPGDTYELPIRFAPAAFGPDAATITVHSNDPTGPKTVVVLGAAPAPRLTVVVPDNGDFGEVRLGRFTDRDLVINNSGPCPLSVTGIISSGPIFVTPQVVSLPLTVDGGDSIAVPIRFQPTHRGSAAATLTIVSNDPNGPVVVNVSGTGWPPLPIAGTPLEGFRLNIIDSQHVFFIGTDKYVHELDIAAGGIWHDNDLTTLAGAVPPIPASDLAGYPLDDNSKHVFFVGTDHHAYELYFTAGDGWVFNDLTALARAVPPISTSALTGHQLGGNSKHVFFIGTDSHVHELFIASGGRWADNDLTTLGGGVPPAPTSDLTSYRLLSDNSQHVFYIGTDNHVHELFINGGSWADNDLTALAGAVPPIPTSALTGYPLGNNSQHVFFIGTDNHVHELFIDGGSWADNDLTALASAVPPIPSSALTGYPLGNNSQHVFFIGADSHVHELDIDGAGWNDHDLTTLAGAVAPTPTSALTGYPLGNSKHVFFIGTDDHVHELFIDGGSWLDNDLTART
jgi:hypothetical protein